jgi:hypothetical protein
MKTLSFADKWKGMRIAQNLCQEEIVFNILSIITCKIQIYACCLYVFLLLYSVPSKGVLICVKS